MNPETDILRKQNQYLQEKLERFESTQVLLNRLARLWVLDTWREITRKGYKELHQYDKVYERNNFQPYQLNYKTEINENAPVVLHIISNFKTGGASRIVVDIAEHLSDKYRHIVVTRYNPKPQNYQGIQVIELCDIPSENKVKKLLKKYNPEIVHIHGGFVWSEGSRLWQWYYAFNKVLEETNIKLIQNVNIPVVPYLFRKNKCEYVFVSHFVLDNYAFQEERNTVIYPGSDFSFFTQEKNKNLDKKQAGMVYRLDDHKLKKQSIEPLILAAKKDGKITVHIVGDGNLRSYYEKRVKDDKLEKQFVFYGYKSYDELPEIYKKWSLFVAPVFEESFGQVTPFALNMGIPVVAYKTDALPEMLQDDDLLVEQGNAEALADKIVELLNNEKLLEQKSEEAKQKAERFEMRQMIEKYQNLYSK